jgi:hypothetical protein
LWSGLAVRALFSRDQTFLSPARKMLTSFVLSMALVVGIAFIEKVGVCVLGNVLVLSRFRLKALELTQTTCLSYPTISFFASDS